MSRRIDAAIAEHVMGHSDVKIGNAHGTEVVWRYEVNKHGSEIMIPIPEYSTCIKAAWEVVEEMGLYGLEWGGPHGDRDKAYVATFCQYKEWIFATADTQPMAICLAALKAKGVEVE